MSDCRTELHSLIGPDAVLGFASPWLNYDVPVARPADEAQLVDLLRYASRSGKRVLPIGNGTKLGWSIPPEHVDFAISTRALTGVIAYEPGDGTLTARAGSLLSDIADVARGGGNHLTPDVPEPSTTTLGGALAAGQSGLDRTPHGPVRHHVLGMRVVLADGTVASSGGRLVKNVTGFDMHRLYCGSHGTLGVIVEASLRLFPGPEREAVARASMNNRSDAVGAARSIAASGANPYAVMIEHRGTPAQDWTVSVLLSGRSEPVEWELETAQRALPGAIVERDARARAIFEELRDRHAPSSNRPSLHIGVMPSKLEYALDILDTAARSAGVLVPCSIHPTIATVDVFPTLDDTKADRTDPPLATWVALVRALRNAKLDVRLRNVPAELALDLGGDHGPGLDWMRRLKRALDPAGVFASGGFHAAS